MNRKLQDILDSLPDKSPRSRLEPYRALIGESRRRNGPIGRSFACSQKNATFESRSARSMILYDCDRGWEEKQRNVSVRRM
jgi:hypothetical protein